MVETRKGRLVEYLKRNLSKGYDSEGLKWALVNQGYSRIEIVDAMNEIEKEREEMKKPKAQEKPKIKYELYDKDNKPINFRKSFWRRLFS